MIPCRPLWNIEPQAACCRSLQTFDTSNILCVNLNSPQNCFLFWLYIKIMEKLSQIHAKYRGRHMYQYYWLGP